MQYHRCTRHPTRTFNPTDPQRSVPGAVLEKLRNTLFGHIHPCRQPTLHPCFQAMGLRGTSSHLARHRTQRSLWLTAAVARVGFVLVVKTLVRQSCGSMFIPFLERSALCIVQYRQGVMTCLAQLHMHCLPLENEASRRQNSDPCASLTTCRFRG